MTDSLKITALNLDISWRDKVKNFARIREELNDSSADLFLLPEMFSTGFDMDAHVAADENEETLSWMKTFAKEKNAAVAGSVAVNDGGKFYNRFNFVEASGNVRFYDKKHLFTFAGENRSYNAGTERVIVTYRGWRLLLQVCYDLRFPVFSRNNEDYDAILYVANWPSARIRAWEALLPARAVENLSYVFGVNRIGKDANGLEYPESTVCYFADGSVCSEVSGNKVTAEFDREKLIRFREKFRFLADRDPFQLG